MNDSDVDPVDDGEAIDTDLQEKVRRLEAELIAQREHFSELIKQQAADTRVALRHQLLAAMYNKDSDIRPRREAVLAFVEIERERDGEAVNLEDVILQFADLEGADLRGANLRLADLGFARLQGADLRDANLTLADLELTKIRGANLRGANLEHAKNLTQDQIDEAEGNVSTTLPDGLERPGHWYDDPEP